MPSKNADGEKENALYVHSLKILFVETRTGFCLRSVKNVCSKKNSKNGLNLLNLTL